MILSSDMVVLQRRGPPRFEGSETLATDARAAVAYKKKERAEANMVSVSGGDSEREGAEEVKLAEELTWALKRASYMEKNK